MADRVGKIVGVQPPDRSGTGEDGGVVLVDKFHRRRVVKMKYQTALELLTAFKGRTVRIDTRAIIVHDLKGKVLYSSKIGGSR